MNILDNNLNVDVIGFGALNLDKLYSVENIAGIDDESYIQSKIDTPGGSAANTIVGLSKLNKKTSFIGKIAEDDPGDIIELNLSKNKVYTNNLIYDEEGKTGEVLGFVDNKGNRALYVDSGVNDNISIDEINPRNINTCKIIHYTSFIGDKSLKAQIQLLDKLDDNIILSFDPGMLYVKRDFNDLYPIFKRTNILFLNEKEFRLLIKDHNNPIDKSAVEFFNNHNMDILVIKQGSYGVFALNKDGHCHVDVFDCDVRDTTGAGDSFNSGFLYGLLNDYDLRCCCRIGNFVASKTIEGYGMENFPSEKDIKEIL